MRVNFGDGEELSEYHSLGSVQTDIMHKMLTCPFLLSSQMILCRSFFIGHILKGVFGGESCIYAKVGWDEVAFTIQYNTINFIEHQNRAITARTMLQIQQV